jgi:hypothetical protein
MRFFQLACVFPILTAAVDAQNQGATESHDQSVTGNGNRTDNVPPVHRHWADRCTACWFGADVASYRSPAYIRAPIEHLQWQASASASCSAGCNQAVNWHQALGSTQTGVLKLFQYSSESETGTDNITLKFGYPVRSSATP